MLQAKLRTLTIVSLAVAQSLFGGNAKSSTGWLSDFEEAKALAAKEGKYILICSCLADLGHRLGGDRFIRSARRRFVLLRVDLAKDEAQAKASDDYRLNHPLLANDISKWWGHRDIRIADAAGSFVKQLANLNDALADTLETSSTRDKAASPKAKGVADKPRIMPVPGTHPTTPAGWMDNFKAAQEIAAREKKGLFVVFAQYNCPPSVSYKKEILSSPIILNELSKKYVLVYLLIGGIDIMEIEEHRHIFDELTEKADSANWRNRRGRYPVTMLIPNDDSKMSIISDSWNEVETLKKQKKLKRRYAEQQLAERFLNFIQEEQKRAAK